MPGRKRKGSKKGGPGSIDVSGGISYLYAQQRAGGLHSSGSPAYEYSTTKRVRTKNKAKGLKDIAQRRKKHK